MTEEFLQYIWKHSLYSRLDTKTTSGEQIEVLNPGQWNTDAGPDFFNASIRINKTVWAGNVEIHKKSSDWNLHGHQNDNAYNNVILHVVLENDQDITLPNGEILPVLILGFNPQLLNNYNDLIARDQWPACSDYIENVNPIYLSATLNSMLVERMNSKTETVLQILKMTNNDWNETFYRMLAHNFGFKTNAQPFDMVARKTPLRVLAKHKGNAIQIEALLFGQSGLLNEQLLGDDYFLQLREEYSYLSKLHQLAGIEGHLWKFLRLRPTNFPTVRIAQFAALISQSDSMLSKLIETESIKNIKQYFKVKASNYWDTHYTFKSISTKRKKWIGDSAIDNILINTVAPFLFIYGDRNNKEILKIRAIELLESLPPEKNSITNRWHELGILAQNAFDSQGLIQLKNVYCDNKNCLKCQLGNKVINR